MNSFKVAILALGGTIAMTKGEDGGVVPTLTGEMLAAAVPGLGELAKIDARTFRQLPSPHLKYGDLEDLAGEIIRLDQAGCRGVVVTQGTDTIEETAFVLDLLTNLEMPVVVTGAMRNPTVAGADGPANLLASVQVAISSEARGCGCLVVMNDEIHAARFVRKTHTSRLDAFSSPASGRLGWVSEGRVFVGSRLERPPAIPLSGAGKDRRVALVTVALGDDGTLIRALPPGQFQGLVVEATGGGHVPVEVADALEVAARRMPVILASRTGAGETLSHTYGFPGGEIDLQRRGLIRSGWLDGLKAKALLTLLLRHGVASVSDISAAFEPWGGGPCR